MLGPRTVADALLDRITAPMEGGRSTSTNNQWVQYNSTGVRLEDWSRQPTSILVSLKWTHAAAHGATLPGDLRDELASLRRSETAEAVKWWEFSNECGGFPHRRRFESDQDHEAAEQAWEIAWTSHITENSRLRAALKHAVARALPLVADDEPVDLLELLNRQQDEPEPYRDRQKQPVAMRASIAATDAARDASASHTPDSPSGSAPTSTGGPTPGR